MASAMAFACWVVAGLLGTSCNALLGLDDVRPASADGGLGGVGGGGGTVSAMGGRGGGAAGTGVAGAGGASGAAGTGAAGTGAAGTGAAGRGGASGAAGTGGASGAAGRGGASGTAGTGAAGRGGTSGAAGTGAAGRGGTSGAAGTGAAGRGGASGAAGTGAAGTGGGLGGLGGGSCGRQLSTNGNFDQGMTSWQEAPQFTPLVRRFDDPDLAAHQVTPQSGQYVLRLGAVDEGKYVVHYVEQNIDIPANARQVTITGYVQVRTGEPTDRVYDEAWVAIFDENTPTAPLFRNVPTWSNLTPNSWTAFSFPVDVVSVAGRRMVFRITAELDTGVATYFYFDTVSVLTTACSP